MIALSILKMIIIIILGTVTTKYSFNPKHEEREDGNMKKNMMIITMFGLMVLAASNVWSQSILKAGDTVPQFSLSFATKDGLDLGAKIGPDVMKGKVFLIAFYPADWSGGCTKEFCTYRDNYKAFEDFGVQVLMISGDYVYAHQQWAKEQNFPFYLLSDHKHDVAREFGVYNEATGYNVRSVFLISKDGRIAYMNPKYSVQDDKDFDALKEAIRTLK